MSDQMRGDGQLVSAAAPRMVKEVFGEEHAVIVTISTETVDRHGDSMSPEGARLERFRRNPVVLYNHDYDGLPVGSSLWEKVGADGITAKAAFHQDTELSKEVWALIVKDILNGWSVGFIPEKWEPLAGEGDAPADGVSGFRILAWDLLEYSAVPVPANFEALTHALKAGGIAAPCLVKSLAPLGLAAPDLVQPVIRAASAHGKESDMTAEELKALTAKALEDGNPELVGKLKAQGAEEEATRAAAEKKAADAEAAKAKAADQQSAEEKLAAARDEAAQGARDQLKALHEAFPEHGDFVREQFEKGASLEEAQAAFRGVELAETKAELANLKSKVEGTEPLDFEGEPEAKTHRQRADDYQAEHSGCSRIEALKKTATPGHRRPRG